jgi:Ca2+-binding EF-hand superfamily protein
MKYTQNILFKSLLLILITHLVTSMNLKSTIQASLALSPKTNAATPKVFFNNAKYDITPCDALGKTIPGQTVTPLGLPISIKQSSAGPAGWLKNPYKELKMGYDASAWFFDFLDPLLMKPFFTEVDAIMKAIPQKPQETPGTPSTDPYTLQKILKKEGESAQLLLEFGKAMGKGYIAANWNTYISTPQIDQILKTWGWDKFENIDESKQAKHFIDEYDSNGDHRLSTTEFVLAMILHNQKSLFESTCKNCLDVFLKDFLDPIFTFADCDKDGYVTTENLWKALKYLDRKTDEGKYNMYKCLINGQPLRTNSVNDFMLKCRGMKTGRVSRSEFVIGMLLGFWNRQTSDDKVEDGNELSQSSLRWKDEARKDDYDCDNLKSQLKLA